MLEYFIFGVICLVTGWTVHKREENRGSLEKLRPLDERTKLDAGAGLHQCPGCGRGIGVYEKEYSKTVCTKCGKRVGWDRETGPYLC